MSAKTERLGIRVDPKTKERMEERAGGRRKLSSYVRTLIETDLEALGERGGL